MEKTIRRNETFFFTFLCLLLCVTELAQRILSHLSRCKISERDFSLTETRGSWPVRGLCTYSENWSYIQGPVTCFTNSNNRDRAKLYHEGGYQLGNQPRVSLISHLEHNLLQSRLGVQCKLPWRSTPIRNEPAS